MIRAFSRAFGIDCRFYIVAALSFAFCFFLVKGRRHKRFIAGFLVAYLVILFSSTVFARSAGNDVVFRFQLFWTYSAIANGGWKAKELVTEILVNIAMMIPIGFCLPVLIKHNRLWWTIACGFLISLIIEMLQLAFQRGLPEIDDIIHNTIGIVVGFCVYKGAECYLNRFRSEKEKTSNS